MSTQNYEEFLEKLAFLRLTNGSLHDFFAENILKDTRKVKWILELCLKFNDMSTINFLLSQGIIIGILNEQKQTAIHISAYKCNFEAIDLLFPYYDSVNYIDSNGLSHFHAACMAGNVGVVENFLNNGVDVNGCFDDHNNNQAPLHIAVKFQRLEIVKLLLKYGADPNPLSCFGTSPLHLVCRGDIEEIRLIVSMKKSHLDAYEMLKDFIEQNCELDMVKILVEYGGEVNIRNCSGDTPMNYVFNVDHLQEIDSILPSFVCDFGIKLKIIQVFRSKQKSKIKFLLSKGTDVRTTNINGDTILHHAIGDIKESRQPSYLEGIHFDDDILAEMIIMFLEHGADVNAKNIKGQSPLQLAIDLLSFKIVKILLDYNADFIGIKFDNFHYNEDIVPCLQAMDNLIKIVHGLKNRGFHLKQNNNLNILKFFVNYNSKYCYIAPNDKQIHYKIKNLLEFGIDHNVRLGLDKLFKNMLYNNKETRISSLKYEMAFQIFEYLTIIENGDLYISQESKDYLRFKISSLNPYSSYSPDRKHTLSNIPQEIEDMKATKLNRCTSLHDILSTNPRHCYTRIKNCDYMTILSSEYIRNKFPKTMGIIEGHFAKSVVWWYVVKSARYYLATLINLRLPDLCCDQIVNYLSYESLFNLCVAAVN